MQQRGRIAEELRRRISTGRYPPGSRIPTRRQLARDLGASPVTLQRAFDRLTEQGFLEARGRRGTFIAEHLPDRTRVALVFGSEPDHGTWNRFWSTLMREGRAWRGTQGERFQIHCLPGESADSAPCQRLLADLADGGLAGVLFASAPHALAASPALAGVPRACVGTGPQSAQWGSTIALGLDPTPALERFVAAGRRRLGVICTRGLASDWRRHAATARRLGLEARQEWWLGMPTDQLQAECARTVAHLLFAGAPDARPDCLLIDDDNLVPHATAGLVDAGLRAPRDVVVIAHANFPHATPAAVRCQRYGIDVLRLFALAVADLARQRAGGAPGVVEVPMAFSDA